MYDGEILFKTCNHGNYTETTTEVPATTVEETTTESATTESTTPTSTGKQSVTTTPLFVIHGICF